MGDVADDMAEEAIEHEAVFNRMIEAGCYPCDHPCHLQDIDSGECPKCKDLGWLNSNGEPCEP